MRSWIADVDSLVSERLVTAEGRGSDFGLGRGDEHNIDAAQELKDEEIAEVVSSIEEGDDDTKQRSGYEYGFGE